MKKLSIVIVFWLIISILCGCGAGKENKQESLGDLPTVTVGYDNYSPFSFMDANGNMMWSWPGRLSRVWDMHLNLFLLIGKIRRICWPKAVLIVSGAVSL